MGSTMKVSMIALFCLLAQTPLDRAFAQASERCLADAATLTSGAVADDRTQGEAYVHIQGCPAAVRGPALSRALERRRTIDRYDDEQAAIFAFATRDVPVFNTLLTLSTDPSASSAARISSVLTLLAMVDTLLGGSDTESFLRSREGSACIVAGPPSTRPLGGGPLPADSMRRVYATFLALERSPTTEVSTRSAAHCALNLLRIRRLGAWSTLAPFRHDDISLSYVCDNLFRLTNRSRYSYLAAMYVGDGSKPRALTINGTLGKSAQVEMVFPAGSGGPVELIVDYTDRYAAANGHHPCSQPAPSSRAKRPPTAK